MNNKILTIVAGVALFTLQSLFGNTHMQGERVLTVELHFQTQNGDPIINADVIYLLPSHKAKDSSLPGKFDLFSKNRKYRFKTDEKGSLTMPVLFHFSYYTFDEPPYSDEFLSSIGLFKIKMDGIWHERELSKDESLPVYIEWVETKYDPFYDTLNESKEIISNQTVLTTPASAPR